MLQDWHLIRIRKESGHSRNLEKVIREVDDAGMTWRQTIKAA